MGCRNTQNEKPQDKCNDTYNNVCHLVQLIHCGFRIIKSQGKGFAFSECIDLQQNGRDDPKGGGEYTYASKPMISQEYTTKKLKKIQ